MVKVDKNVKLQGWERKSILRNTIGLQLPQSILNAPKKGFGIPLRNWFKENSFEATIDSNLNEVKSILDESTIAKIIVENKEGLRDNGSFIWSMMVLNKIISK